MTNNWTNDATLAAKCYLSSMRYGKLMDRSRAIFREAAGSNRSIIAFQRLADCIRELAVADKLAGHLVGIGLDDIDFTQIADWWLGGIAAYQPLVSLTVPCQQPASGG